MDLSPRVTALVDYDQKISARKVAMSTHIETVLANDSTLSMRKLAWP